MDIPAPALAHLDKFQSLSGIMVVSHDGETFTPSYGWEFQSLSGIMVVSHQSQDLKHVKLICWFQSLSGIMVVSHIKKANIQWSAKQLFQSLSGIMVVSHGFCLYILHVFVIQFQSLSGIMVVSHIEYDEIDIPQLDVSIPFRDYGGFPHRKSRPSWKNGKVSIPFRDYGGFPPLQQPSLKGLRGKFQSLSGIMVVSH